MSQKLLIRILSEGQILILSSTPGEDIEAKPNAKIQVVDEEYRPVVNVVPRRVGDDLLIWSDDELVGTITGFFEDGMENVLVSNYYDPLLGEIDQPEAELADDSGIADSIAQQDEGMGWKSYAIGGAALIGAALYAGSDSGDDSGTTGSSGLDGSDGNDGSDTVVAQATGLDVSAIAGSFISAALVEVYSADGDLLVRSTLSSSSGNVSIEIPESANYSGLALVIITDVNDAEADYVSEATGEETSLDGSLRLMTSVEAGEDMTLSVTPLTELAARLAGVPDSPSLLTVNPLTESQLAYNDLVAQLFGLTDLLSSVVALDNDAFDMSDGFSAAESYGDLLAILSGLEQNSGGLDASLAALMAEIQLDDAGNLSLTGAGGNLLQEAYATFKAGPNAELLDSQSVAALVPSLVTTADVIDQSTASSGVELQVPGVASGDLVTLWLDDQQIGSFTVASLNDDGSVNLNLDQTVLAQFDGTAQDLVVQVNGVARLPIEVDIDVTTPTLEIQVSDGLLTIDETASIEFIFSEAIEGFSLDDIQLSSGGLGELSSADNGLTWQAVYTPETNLDLTLVSISVVSDLTDAQGNALVKIEGDLDGLVAQTSLEVDTRRPILSMSLSDEALIYGETASLTIQFSETVSGFGLDDFELDNATLSDLTSDETGLIWTATLTPDVDAESSLNSVRLSLDWTDASGNASLIYYASDSYSVDTLVPAITSAATVSIVENTASGSLVYTIESTDSSATYSLSGDDAIYFSVNASTGAITLLETADYETRTSYELSLVVTDSSGNQQTQDLLLSVTDVDDTAPNFISGTSVSLDENSGAGELVYQATTDDPDATLVLQGSDRSAFRFDSESGAVTLIANPDYETKSSYEFDMVATDEAGNSQTQTVTLRINDLDEVAPTFLSGTSASIDENSGSNQQVYQTSTNDSSATYSLSGAQSASFSINSSTGAVSLLENPNYESRSSYSFSVIAEDSAGNRSERSVTLSVNNLDEIAPEFTSGTTATSVNENSGAGVLVYTAVVDDSADTSSGVTFSLAGSHASAFEIDSSSGEVRLRADANYESLSNYSFSVIATDAAGNQSSQPVSMAVNNLDEEAPAFTSSATADAIDENSGGGSVVYRATTSDDADISAGVTYTLSGTHADYFTIDGASGAVTLKEDANYEDLSSYQFVVIAEDVAGNSQDLTVTLAVTNLDEVAPVFTSGTTATDTSENSTVGTLVYTAIVDDSQDVSAGVTYELSGSDADAFQIDANGAVTLAESPDFETQPGYSFVITATDGAGLQVQQSVSLTILDVDEIPPVVTSTPDNLVVDDGAGAGDTVYQAQSSEDGVSYGLEGGDSAYFDIDPETGAITLLDDADFDSQSEFTFTVLVTDEAGNVTRQPVTITINNVAPTITSGTELTAVDENTGAGEQVYQATSNDAQATFGLSGADQAYFEIDSETGVVTLLADADHETKSSYSFTVTATDTTNLVGSLNLTLNVNDIDEIAPQFADTGSRSGGFVSVWVSDGQDGDAAGVYAQLFDADGLLSGSEFLVNSYTTSSQWQPAVTSLVSGGFVVVWSSEGQDGSGSGLYARLYDEAGVAADVEFLVNATVAGDQQLASVTALSDGGFVVVWQTTGQDADGLAIYAQRYDSDGNASGSEFQVNQTEVADQSGPQVTALADGGYAVSWVSDGQDGDSAGVYVQSYRANGNVAVAETRVNTYTAGSQSSVELTGLTFGGFVVAWVSDAQDGSGSGVYFQRFNSSGYSVGSETLVNETTTGNQSEVTITALADGGFVVVWNSDDAGSEGIYARIYDSDGEAQSDEFQVDSGAATTVSDPEVTWLADGGFIISWQSVGQDGDGSGVYAQRFAANGNQVGLEYQVNTSTTGDQTSTDLSSLVDNHTTTIRIDEGTGAGEVIYIPYLIDTADIDDDTDTTDELVYSPSGPDRAYFDIDPDTGYVTLLENADYETRSSYSFTVTAKDPAGESADHDVVLSVRDIEERDVIIDLVSGVSSLDTDGDRVFNDDMTYNIYILVDSDSANLTLATGQNWLSGQNLGADDTIYLVGDGSTVASDSGDPVSAIGTVLESGEGDNLWWGASESDLAVSIDARVITRYYGGNTDDVIWYLGGDWAEGDTPNSGQDVSLVSLDSLPARVEEELNWS